MSVVLLMCDGPEARRARVLRWLAMLGHHAFDVRTADDARLALGCVRADLVIVDASSSDDDDEGGPVAVAVGEGGEPVATAAERAAIDLLDHRARTGGSLPPVSLPPVFVVGAPPSAYRHFRLKLAVGDRFLDVPVDSKQAKHEIAEFLQRTDIPLHMPLPGRDARSHFNSN